MKYFLVLRVPMNVALVSRITFETAEAAEVHRSTNYAAFPAMEILSEDAVDCLTERVVMFPEKLPD